MTDRIKRANNVIELIAVAEKFVYSIGKIQITQKGDIYLISKIKNMGFHFSRHKDGNCHIRIKGLESTEDFEKRIPINSFDGFEVLGIWAFGLDSLPRLYKEYKPKKCNAVIAVYIGHLISFTFNLCVAILTEKGIPLLMNQWKDFENRQVYICANSRPMFGLVLGAVKGKSGKSSDQ